MSVAERVGVYAAKRVQAGSIGGRVLGTERKEEACQWMVETSIKSGRFSGQLKCSL